MIRMDSEVRDLRVMHRPKSPGWPTLSECPPGVFVIDTCLRQVRIIVSPADGFAGWATNQPHDDWMPTSAHRSGADAYRLLLEIATGLRSAIPGETNISGQFKKAWAGFRRLHPATNLTPIMRRLFDDTKTIRRDYLEGIGGSSYGGLVRKLIDPKRGDRILFVGAGALARSMLPFFSNHVVGIWNYRDTAAMSHHVERVFHASQGRPAAAWADHVILTTPPDNENDVQWDAWLDATRTKSVVHLGHRGSRQPAQNSPGWGNASACYNLDDVFTLRRGQADFRSDRLNLAWAACQRIANAGIAGTPRISISNSPMNMLIDERRIREPDLAPA